MGLQKTIKNPFSLSGIGIHSGENCVIKVHPAPEDYGIVFVKNGKEIKATVENVADTQLGTSLSGIKITEHFLAAIAGLEIDNLKIEIEGEEIPILDGSTLSFVEAIEKVGITEQNKEKNFIVIKEPIKISEEGKTLEVLPYDGFRITFMVNFKVVGRQQLIFDAEKDSFEKDIAPARTFGYFEDYEALKAKGYAQGASLENALVVSQDGYMNAPRFPDEVVRHKILDLIGDLVLAGRPLRGELIANQSGHKMNIELARRIKNL